MKSLILAEKPSVARDIARVLECRKSLPGALEGSQYIVTWALGHLVTLADPEEYNPDYKTWNLSDLPMMPEQWKLVVIKQTSAQFRNVKTQMFRKDVKEIIIATDAGREGELVARWILEKTGCRKSIRRLWISSVTDKAIKDGFASLKDGRKYEPLYQAARSRAIADWLVGMNATRALTCKYNAQLSCGRVQTPTLAIIAGREKEISAFRPQEYYGVECTAGNVKWNWQDKKSGSHRTFSRNMMEEIHHSLKGQSLKILEIRKMQKKTASPGLYDLTELQRDANRRFGFSTKETLNIMQRLYEHHKVLTYPRTDSRYIGTDIVPTLKERIKACNFGSYRKYAAELLKKPLRTGKSFVDDRKVSDHHAIIPTEVYAQLEYMSNEERKIYDLVVRRFLSVLFPPFEYEQTTMKAEAAGQIFTASGQIVRSPGWHAIYGEELFPENESDDDDTRWTAGTGAADQQLPFLEQGESLPIVQVRFVQGKTKPPARFTEATLLSAMENPVRYMESKDAGQRRVLGEMGGLGTVATRADIIEKLFHSFFIEKKGSEIWITSKGKQLLELVPEDLKKPELTARWEMELSRIAKGEQKQNAFLREIQNYTQELVQEIQKAGGTFRHDNLTGTKCPQCGKRMLAVNGKNARLLVCQDRECGYRETVARQSNARCPNCHKKMEMIKKGQEEMFVCSCGYKEKLSAFKKRREKEGAGVSKKEVQRYLKQQKEEAVNTAFADALSKLKL